MAGMLGIKRRLTKISDNQYRADLPGADYSEFSYFEKTKRYDSALGIHVNFSPGENNWVLFWEGVMVDTFLCEEDVLCYIIRFAYSINQMYLIPSEILADFGIVYEAGDWVDEWMCPDEHQVIFTQKTIMRPPFRKIRFSGEPTRGNKSYPLPKKKHKENLWQKIRGITNYTKPIYVRPPEPPDEECIWSLKSGKDAETAYIAKKKLFLDLQKDLQRE